MMIYEAMNHHGSRFFERENVSVWVSYDNADVQIVDLTNALQRGKTCRFWHFSTTPYYLQTDRLDVSEYVEQAYPAADSFGSLVALLRSGAAPEVVDHCKISAGETPATRVYSPFVKVKPGKLNLSRLNAATVARAILAGQITGGRVDEITTDDYAFDAAVDFQRGAFDVRKFAVDLIEHPSGWRFWSTKPGEITAACHTFDYRTLYLN